LLDLEATIVYERLCRPGSYSRF